MELKCCICGTEFVGYGNNAEPIRKGVCCNKCNSHYVIASRLLGAVNASYEIIKTHKEKEAIKQKLISKNFTLHQLMEYNEHWHNIENEEDVILCIL